MTLGIIEVSYLDLLRIEPRTNFNLTEYPMGDAERNFMEGIDKEFIQHPEYLRMKLGGTYIVPNPHEYDGDDAGVEMVVVEITYRKKLDGSTENVIVFSDALVTCPGE